MLKVGKADAATLKGLYRRRGVMKFVMSLISATTAYAMVHFNPEKELDPLAVVAVGLQGADALACFLGGLGLYASSCDQPDGGGDAAFAAACLLTSRIVFLGGSMACSWTTTTFFVCTAYLLQAMLVLSYIAFGWSAHARLAVLQEDAALESTAMSAKVRLML